MIELRPGRPDDAPQLAALDAATSTQGWSQATFAGELVRDDRRYVLAVVADPGRAIDTDVEVVGYGALAVLAGEGHVLGLAVAERRRGRGLGRQLLEALLAAAATAGVAAVTLEVRPSNLAARRLYGAVGFEPAGRRPRYYPDGEDALILWRYERDTSMLAPMTANPGVEGS